MQSPNPDSGSSTINANEPVPADSTEPADENRKIRTIPPWVETVADEDHGHDHLQPLLRPASTVHAAHHYLPNDPHHHKGPGRKWDHRRDAEPAMLDQPLNVSSARWIPYMLSGPQPQDVEGVRLVSDEWMNENMPGMAGPWHSHIEEQEAAEREKGAWLFDADRRHGTVLRAEVSA